MSPGVAANDEREIRELVAAWMAATKAGGIDDVRALMTDNAVTQS